MGTIRQTQGKKILYAIQDIKTGDYLYNKVSDGDIYKEGKLPIFYPTEEVAKDLQPNRITTRIVPFTITWNWDY